MKEILVTTALPYANGPLHLGHLLEHIQSDIWVRTNRVLNYQCYFVCGSDAHGTPIMLAAEKKGIPPEVLAQKYQDEHQNTLKNFNIHYDEFYTTHSTINQELVLDFFKTLQKNNDLEIKEIAQFYDPEKKMFLPDRMIKGTCPQCKALDQYGDNCEICGAHYQPTELIDPRSAISNTIPILKTSVHYFFAIKKYQSQIQNWLSNDPNIIPKAVYNKLQEWFAQELHSWDISRDAPYFGFAIPNEKDKYFYVWLDTPVGYIAACKKLCKTTGLDFNKFFQQNSTIEMHHFIGKDISYFHTIFWPALLLSSNLKLPTKIMIHGYLSINGEKMSKSRGIFITGDEYLQVGDPECLRYYFASKLTSGIDDLDLNFTEFVSKINADLVGKFINIASRSIALLDKHFNLHLATKLTTNELIPALLAEKSIIFDYYLAGEYAKAIKIIMALADLTNKYFNDHKPWTLHNELPKLHAILTITINAFRILSFYLQPVLPTLTQKITQMLNCDLSCIAITIPLLNTKINPYQPLLLRIQLEQFMPLTNPQKKTITSNQSNNASIAGSIPGSIEPIKPLITIDDFSKIDLRIATIINAEEVLDSHKLLKLTVNFGAGDKIIFAGIKEAFKPEQLINKLTVVVANLAPRKMRFGTSEGMVLIASDPTTKTALYLLEPHAGAIPGMQVK